MKIAFPLTMGCIGEKMTNIVLKYKSFLDKHVGDAITAIRSPVNQPDHAQWAQTIFYKVLWAIDAP